jgi:hypothetical protein
LAAGLIAAALAAAVLSPGPAAVAQEGAPLRYTITPTGEGFVRLDTETGTTTHCSQSEGVWRCDPPVYGESELEARLAALNDKIDALGRDLAALAGRLPAAPPTMSPPAAEERPEVQLPTYRPAAPNFFERALERLFLLVGGMKEELARD